MPYEITLIEKRLTDSSKVYDVVLAGPWLARFSCVSMKDADAFIEGFRSLLAAHTNEAVTDRVRLGFEREG